MRDPHYKGYLKGLILIPLIIALAYFAKAKNDGSAISDSDMRNHVREAEAAASKLPSLDNNVDPESANRMDAILKKHGLSSDEAAPPSRK